MPVPIQNAMQTMRLPNRLTFTSDFIIAGVSTIREYGGLSNSFIKALNWTSAELIDLGCISKYSKLPYTKCD